MKIFDIPLFFTHPVVTYSTDIDIDPLLSLELGKGMESIVSSSILDSDSLSQVGINAKY